MTESHQPALSVVAPAYQEEECIEAVLRSWLAVLDAHKIDGEVVIANDGSTDGTGQLVARLGEEDPRVRLVALTENRGYGPALKAAIDDARAPWIVTMDSDGQFDPADIPRLLAHRQQTGADLVTGHRRKKNDRASRVLADRGLRSLVRGLFGLKVHDSNCAIKLLPASWIQGVELEAKGFPTPTEILVRAKWAGLRIEEIDVAHLPRAGGRTKLKFLETATSMFAFLVRLRLQGPT